MKYILLILCLGSTALAQVADEKKPDQAIAQSIPSYRTHRDDHPTPNADTRKLVEEPQLGVARLGLTGTLAGVVSGLVIGLFNMYIAVQNKAKDMTIAERAREKDLEIAKLGRTKDLEIAERTRVQARENNRREVAQKMALELWKAKH